MQKILDHFVATNLSSPDELLKELIQITTSRLIKKVKEIEFENDTLKIHAIKIEKKNNELESQILEFHNLQMQIACINILNKILTIFLIISIFTTTTHSFDKIVSQGFSYFDWICFFIITISYTAKFPKFLYLVKIVQ